MAIANDYSISNDGKITFYTIGTYTFTMTNEAITSHLDYPAKVIATVKVDNVGIAENTISKIKIYPNPSTKQLKMKN